ncbi:MAG: hypothetical protein IKA87_05635 [Lentisphaeria bacterium]|nr:hypothetical protein [Lentisphaeria bacterium]
MKNLYIYLFPLVMDIIISGVLFISVYRFSEAKVEGWIVGATMAVWAVIYSLISWLCGYIVNKDNAHKVVLSSCIGISLVAAGFLVFDGLYTQFLWLILTGCCGAFFFAPFQIYLKRFIPGNAGIIRTTALYTGAWSLGFSLGPLAFRLLSQQNAFIFFIVCGVAMVLGLIAVEKFAKSPEEISVAAYDGNVKNIYEGLPDLVWVGYLVSGVGCLTISLVRTMGPFRGVALLNFTKDEMSMIMFIVSLLQSLTGLLMIFSKKWMYKKIPGLLLNGAGILALLGFGFCNSYIGFVISAVFFGIYAGCFYFFFVFHSLVHPTKSAKYIAGNETIVGVSGVVSPVLAGLLVTPASSGWSFFTGAILVIAAMVGQQIMLARHKNISI